MKGLVASVVCIILVVQVLSAQGEREKGNEIQGAEDSLSNGDGTKLDEIDGWRKLRSINNASEDDLSPSKADHKKSRRTVSLPQNTEDHDSRSSLQKCNPTRTKRDTEIPEDDISLNFDASRKSKRKSAKLKLAGVCKSGKASRKLLKAIEQNSDEDSGEKISFMDDYISPPLTSDHTSTLQGHQNTNGDVNSDTVANNNDGLETNMAQVGPDVEMSSTRDIEPSTGKGNGDQVDQTVMNDSPSILTDEVGNSDREAAPSVGTLVELKGEPGREQQGLSGQSAVSQSEYGPNEMSEGADFGPKTKVSENMELISTRPEESTPLQSQSPVDNSYGTPLGNDGLPPNSGTDDENSMSTGTPTSQFSVGHNLPTKQNEETNYYQDSNPTATNTGTSSFPYSTTNQQMLSSIKPPLQSQSHVANSNVTPLGTSATYDNRVPLAAGTSDGNSEYIETPTLPSDAGLPTAQNSEAYQYEDSNPTATNTGTSSFPYSTTNQQTLSSIKPPLQSQSHVDNSNVAPFGMSATYDNGVPPATGTSNGNMDYVWTPTSQLSAGLLATQNGEIYPNDKTNPTETPYSVSTPYEKQMITNIRPSLQSQSLVFNSDGGSDLSATYNNGVSPPLGASDENIGYTGTPTSQFSAGLNLPTPQNGEIYNHDQSNPPDTSYSPFITTNQQMLGHRPPLQSQSFIDNNHGTPLDISASYDRGVPAAAGSKENNGYVGTPTSQYSAGLDSPTAHNGEIYNHDQSNTSVINLDSSYPPHFTTNQQMLSLGPSLQGQSLADNSNVAPLSMSATYENPGTDDENSRSIETPSSKYSAGLNSLGSLNGDTSSLPFSATNQQMLSLKPSLQSQSFADNSNIAPLSMSATYENPGTDDENSRSIETPTSQYSAGLNSLTSLNGVDNNHGTPLDISATYGNGVIGAVGSKENSGYTGTPISKFSAGLNLPTTQNGAIYSYDGSNGTPTNSEISSTSFSTNDHQIRPPLQNISPVDISEGTPSGTSASYATDNERIPFSFDKGSGSSSYNSTMLLGDSPSIKDGIHREVMLEGNQKLTPSFITSQLENNPNYTAWRESIPNSDGLSRPRCVCTCDSNQHFFI